MVQDHSQLHSLWKRDLEHSDSGQRVHAAKLTHAYSQLMSEGGSTCDKCQQTYNSPCRTFTSGTLNTGKVSFSTKQNVCTFMDGFLFQTRGLDSRLSFTSSSTLMSSLRKHLVQPRIQASCLKRRPGIHCLRMRLVISKIISKTASKIVTRIVAYNPDLHSRLLKLQHERILRDYRSTTMATCRFCFTFLDVRHRYSLFNARVSSNDLPVRFRKLLQLPVEEGDGLSAYYCRKCVSRLCSVEKTLEEMIMISLARSSYSKAGYSETSHPAIANSPIARENSRKRVKDTSGKTVSPHTTQARPKAINVLQGRQEEG